MKKRLLKKLINKMSNSELFEHVAYSENQIKVLSEKEFDRRFSDRKLALESIKMVKKKPSLRGLD